MTSPTYWFPPTTLPSQSEHARTATAGDRAAPDVYVFDQHEVISRAVNVAGATGRPLLIDGPSGCGKSSLAYYIAWAMRWDLFPFSITSRTQAGDLLYTVDHLRRLRDAQVDKLGKMERYVRPGVLWKGFDPEGASRIGSAVPAAPESVTNGSALPQPGRGAVVLIDEIDKADPDVPNNLLLPLGSYQFEVPELNTVVRSRQVPFVVLTTNNERKLPPAFLRRCVHLTLPDPDQDRLIKAGRAHKAGSEETIKTIAELFCPAQGAPPRPEAPVSIAEYLDAVRACEKLGIDPTQDDWKWVQSIVLGRGDQQGGGP